METKMNLKKAGVGLAAAAASVFIVSHLSGCATEMAAQNSTAATTQIQHSCKGVAATDAEPIPHYKGRHHSHHRRAEQEEVKHHGSTKKAAAPQRRSKANACGVAGQ